MRVFGILNSLLKNGAKIKFISSAKKTKLPFSGLTDYPQISIHSINPNDELEVKSVFEAINDKPDFAIFDTFVAEEMFRYSPYQLSITSKFTCL